MSTLVNSIFNFVNFNNLLFFLVQGTQFEKHCEAAGPLYGPSSPILHLWSDEFVLSDAASFSNTSSASKETNPPPNS